MESIDLFNITSPGFRNLLILFRAFFQLVSNYLSCCDLLRDQKITLFVFIKLIRVLLFNLIMTHIFEVKKIKKISFKNKTEIKTNNRANPII